MQVIEKTKDGIWYESSDGTECFLSNGDVEDMRELLADNSWNHGGINE